MTLLSTKIRGPVGWLCGIQFQAALQRFAPRHVKAEKLDAESVVAMVHPSGQQMTVRHITRLSIEDQQAMAADSSELVISHPQWCQIEDAIRRLDGKYRTLVILGQENTESDYMVVGGGKDRLYWCGIYDKEGREFVAVDPSKSSTTCVKVPTGQPTSVPLKETIGLEDAVAAAREYAETGQRTTKLTWEERK
jgi:hypothetical protein